MAKRNYTCGDCAYVQKCEENPRLRRFNRENPAKYCESFKLATDVVEVVRCKDCEYFLKAEVNGNGFLICSVTDKEIFEEDFCSYGERRESDASD